jgi:HK97 gp10 family phage protein
MKLYVQGVAEINKALRQLAPKIQKKVLRQSIRKALKPVKAAVEAEAPIGETGQIKANVKIKSGKRQKDTLRLNVVIGAGDFKGDQFYASFVEYGHHIGSRTLGDARAFYEGNDFMKRAFDRTKDQATSEVRRLILIGAMKEADKAKGASGN